MRRVRYYRYLRKDMGYSRKVAWELSGSYARKRGLGR